MRSHRRAVRTVPALLALVIAAVGVALFPTDSSAHAAPRVSAATCAARPWTKASYQASSTPAALASLVLACLQKEFPSTFRRDEVGLVALNAYHWFQNINEFGNNSSVQKQLATLGIPPITLEDGPGGLITHSIPAPTRMPDDLALGATFDPSLASLYGTVLGEQAHAMGYDGVQAPMLNLLRVPTWGRAFESLGESPVLAGELAAAEVVAIASQHVIPILKHFGPYSQDTNRRILNQIVSDKALQELYIRPFTLALRALLPLLRAGSHAVGIMCSYGNINELKACRSPLVADELNYVGVDALVRSDLEVLVNPSALVLNGVDLIKPMDTGELVSALKDPGVDAALNASVLQIFETEFQAGLVNGKATVAQPHALPSSLAAQGNLDALAIEQRAAVLLKNTGVLPLTGSDSRIAVITDGELPQTCITLAGTLTRALRVSATCTNASRVSLPTTKLFPDLHNEVNLVTKRASFTAPVSGPYVVQVTTLGNTELSMGGRQILNSQGLAEFEVQRTALVELAEHKTYHFSLTYKGAAPTSVIVIRELNEQRAAIGATRGANVAIFLGYDLAKEGMDRSSLSLPYAQNALISAIASRLPTIVLLGVDGPVTMPWLANVQGVMVVWSPSGSVQTDPNLNRFVTAWTNLLVGDADPSGRLPVTFPVTTGQSPAGVSSFWPGIGSNVDLNEAPDDGVGIGMAWYRLAGWPVLFPFGYGLSYTTYQIVGGSLQSTSNGISMNVEVRDTGPQAGIEPIQVYANWPSAAGEPRLQLVGFGTAVFSKGDVNSAATVRVTIPISNDAMTVLEGSSMKLVAGTYCLEAATYDGDPHAWSTGSVTLTPKGSALSANGSDALAQTTCPS